MVCISPPRILRDPVSCRGNSSRGDSVFSAVSTFFQRVSIDFIQPCLRLENIRADRASRTRDKLLSGGRMIQERTVHSPGTKIDSQPLPLDVGSKLGCEAVKSSKAARSRTSSPVSRRSSERTLVRNGESLLCSPSSTRSTETLDTACRESHTPDTPSFRTLRTSSSTSTLQPGSRIAGRRVGKRLPPEINTSLDSLLLSSTPPPTAMSSSSAPSTPTLSLLPSPIVDERNIHPLFRSDSPSPPPTPTARTMVRASPVAGQTITVTALRTFRSKTSLQAAHSRGSA